MDSWRGEFNEVWELVHPLPGWLRETPASVLYGSVRARRQPVVVEVGSFCGKSSVLLGKAAEKAGGQVYCVDPFDGRGSIYYRVPEGYKDIYDFWQHAVSAACLTNVFPRRGTSLEVAGAWRGPIDVLYIDADHDPPAPKLDFLAWSPFLVSGGVLLMDDVDEPGPEVLWHWLRDHPDWEHVKVFGTKLLAAVKK